MQYVVHWTFGGNDFYAAADVGPAAVTYTVGTLTGGKMNSGPAVLETFTPGPCGKITWTPTRAMIGNPASSAVLTDTYADDHRSFTAAGTGLHCVVAVDRAADAGNSATYTIGGRGKTARPTGQAFGGVQREWGAGGTRRLHPGLTHLWHGGHVCRCFRIGRSLGVSAESLGVRVDIVGCDPCYAGDAGTV